jgi:hypothetical protein
LEYVWLAFIDLSDRRGFVVGHGVFLWSPITFSEIRDYMALFQVGFELWEIRLLLELDDAILPLLNKVKKEPEGIDPNDVAAVKAMMSGVSKKAKPKKG